jgi:hypothetical protein
VIIEDHKRDKYLEVYYSGWMMTAEQARAWAHPTASVNNFFAIMTAQQGI